MALWTTYSDTDHDVYTIVYLLKDALQSALDDAWFFERTSCPKPEVKGAGYAEISARLGRYRDACNGFKEREAMMLTKLLRARLWAGELRKLSPEVHDEIDQFLDATEQCHKLQGDFLNDVQRMFNGGGSLSRFLMKRRGEDSFGSAGEARAKPRDYLVGGQTALLELRVSCEVFLSQIVDRFFSEQIGNPDREAKKRDDFLAYLEAAEDQIPGGEFAAQEAVH